MGLKKQPTLWPLLLLLADGMTSSIELADIYRNYKFIAGTDEVGRGALAGDCLLYTSPSPRDRQKTRMPSSA